MKYSSADWGPRVVPRGQFLFVALLAGGLWLISLTGFGLLGVGAVRGREQEIGPLGWVAWFFAFVCLSGMLSAAHVFSQVAHGGRDAPALVRGARWFTYVGLALYLSAMWVLAANTSSGLHFQGVG